VTQWLINSMTDVLIAFGLATVLLLVGTVNYPELFPQRFFHYWAVATPAAATARAGTTVQQVSAVTQVQH